jgi:ribose transport system substrate-binding protein
VRIFGAAAPLCCLGLLVAACGSSSTASSQDRTTTNAPNQKTTSTPQEGTRSAANGDGATFPKDAAGKVIGMSGLWNSNQGVKLMQDAIVGAIRARGATAKLLQADAKDPVNTLISNLDQLTSQHVDAAGFYPIDPNALTAPTKRALAANIPVVSFELSNSPATVMLHQGREAAAGTVAESVCKLLPDGGKIVYGAYGQPDPTLNGYRKNFTSRLARCSGAKIKIAAVFENKTDDVAGALEPAVAALQRVPDAKAIVAYSDVTAIGASRAASQLGMRKQLAIFGYALAPEGIEAIHKGTIDYSLPSPVAMGQYFGNMEVDLALGKKVPKYTTFWIKCYGKSNIDELPAPTEQLAAIEQGRSLIDPKKDIATSDSAPIYTPKTPLPGCPV